MWLINNDNNLLDSQSVNNTVNVGRLFSASVTTALVLLLAACSGGSGGGATDKNAADVIGDGGGSSGFIYSGPPPANSEIQSFKREFYDNLVINGRCGDCHTPGGPGPTAFVDRDDVNNAWQAANSVVNLQDPAASAVVQRVANGHNCWLGADQTAACQSTMVGYIQAWAGGASGGTATVQLLPRPIIDPTGTKRAEQDYTNTNFATPDTASRSLHDLLTTYCSECHTAVAANPQAPYFATASPQEQVAYEAALSKINLVDPAQSRLVIRLRNEGHNCWSNCADDANLMQEAIEDITNDLQITEVDSSLLISKAQVLMTHGILAQSGGRYEDDIIAEWRFSECIDPADINDCLAEPQNIITSSDTSGVQPEIPLTLSGGYKLLSSGGIEFSNGGKAIGLANTSSKLRDRLGGAGEYTIEAWVIPGNVTQEDTSIISYSGLSQNRNFLLGQTLYNYDFYNRSSVAVDASAGGPALSTDDDDELAQATLQHVVATYDPVNGRRVYVNGEFSGVDDSLGGGNLSSWNDTFSVVLGNDASSARAWSGIIRYAALHSRALTDEQIQQNFDVGIGVNYFLMFSVSEIIDQEGVCHEGSGSSRNNYCYVVFEVSQLDEYAYVFNDPFFVSLRESDFNLSSLNIKGIRIGVNGKLAASGQAFTHVDTVITSSNYTAGGVPLADIGTIIPLEDGATADMFFLAFEQLNGQTGVVTAPIPAPTPFTYNYGGAQVSDIGVRTFEEINESFAQITGLVSTQQDIHEVYAGNPADASDQGIKRQLPTIADFQTYQASHQTAVAQLAIAYCDVLVSDTTRRASFFNDGSSFDFSQRADLVSDSDWSNKVIYPLLDAVLIFGGADPRNLNSQPSRATTHDMLLNTLITQEADNGPHEFNQASATYTSNPDGVPDGLARCDGPGSSFECPTGRTEDVVKAVCAAVLGSAAVILQ